MMPSDCCVARRACVSSESDIRRGQILTWENERRSSVSVSVQNAECGRLRFHIPRLAIWISFPPLLLRLSVPMNAWCDVRAVRRMARDKSMSQISTVSHRHQLCEAEHGSLAGLICLILQKQIKIPPQKSRHAKPGRDGENALFGFSCITCSVCVGWNCPLFSCNTFIFCSPRCFASWWRCRWLWCDYRDAREYIHIKRIHRH